MNKKFEVYENMVKKQQQKEVYRVEVYKNPAAEEYEIFVDNVHVACIEIHRDGGYTIYIHPEQAKVNMVALHKFGE